MKALAQTTAKIMLICPTTGQMITYDRPYVVEFTPFFEARTGKGEIRLVEAGLPDEATDEEFVACLKESGDLELAVAAFLSIVKPEPAPKAEAKAKPASKAKA